MGKINLALLTGGYEAESNISLLSSINVFEWLDKTRFDVKLIVVEPGDWYWENENKQRFSVDKNDFSLNLNDRKIKFDLAVFFPLHGTPAEDGKLQAYFDLLKVRYTGCNVLCSSLTFDKDACKKFLSGTGIKMARSILCKHKERIQEHLIRVKTELNMPVFVKPNKHGSSYGVTRVESFDQLEEALYKSFGFDSEVMVEEFIEGREFSCGAYELNGEVVSLPPTEIISSTGFFDYEAKYLGKSKEITPADLSPELTRKIRELTGLIFVETNCSAMARVDFILKGDDFYFLEINTVPGMTAESILPQQVKAMGQSIEWLLNALIDERLATN
ncbi:MAG: D-alanine--D-alanine ligase [Flavobacteriales bacterium]|nr:D-alanine--D-alanine ligase [Flavobacteriales bacterium]